MTKPLTDARFSTILNQVLTKLWSWDPVITRALFSPDGLFSLIEGFWRLVVFNEAWRHSVHFMILRAHLEGVCWTCWLFTILRLHPEGVCWRHGDLTNEVTPWSCRMNPNRGSPNQSESPSQSWSIIESKHMKMWGIIMRTAWWTGLKDKDLSLYLVFVYTYHQEETHTIQVRRQLWKDYPQPFVVPSSSSTTCL